MTRTCKTRRPVRAAAGSGPVLVVLCFGCAGARTDPGGGPCRRCDGSAVDPNPDGHRPSHEPADRREQGASVQTFDPVKSLAPDGTGVFWLNEHYDRDRASDGISRYGAYLRQNLHRFDPWGEGVDTDPADFTAAAWQVATSPIMSPAYLACRWDRVLSTAIQRAENGAALANLELAATAPRELDGRITSGWNTWTHDRGLRAYLEPSQEQMALYPTLLPRVNLLLPVPAAKLHQPSPTLTGQRPDKVTDALLTGAAKRVVATLAVALNELLVPIVAAMEQGRPL
ncbi:hypothetical protein [Actinomadura rupiterrae]|uniref:hypothetical protein n=1 Tax=Actinomadura rupiterrae TaxID=559627 RepID=UPI0020A27939|nr:hypothetical protein [Actinomadura rupiterrae]MCP2337903.1 hypothetical protein [Actinomadura rupiterrae]